MTEPSVTVIPQGEPLPQGLADWCVWHALDWQGLELHPHPAEGDKGRGKMQDRLFCLGTLQFGCAGAAKGCPGMGAGGWLHAPHRAPRPKKKFLNGSQQHPVVIDTNAEVIRTIKMRFFIGVSMICTASVFVRLRSITTQN